MELERLLARHGATEFGTFHDAQGRATVLYRMQGRMVRHHVERAGKGSEAKVEGEARRKWRALLLITKAKLEMIAAGDTTFEREFLHDVLLADGSTVGEAVAAQLEEAYKSGVATPLRLGAGR